MEFILSEHANNKRDRESKISVGKDERRKGLSKL